MLIVHFLQYKFKEEKVYDKIQAELLHIGRIIANDYLLLKG